MQQNTSSCAHVLAAVEAASWETMRPPSAAAAVAAVVYIALLTEQATPAEATAGVEVITVAGALCLLYTVYGNMNAVASHS